MYIFNQEYKPCSFIESGLCNIIYRVLNTVFLTSSLGDALSWEIKLLIKDLWQMDGVKFSIYYSRQIVPRRQSIKQKTYPVASSAVVLEFDTLVPRNVVRNQIVPDSVSLFHVTLLKRVTSKKFLLDPGNPCSLAISTSWIQDSSYCCCYR